VSFERILEYRQSALRQFGTPAIKSEFFQNQLFLRERHVLDCFSSVILKEQKITMATAADIQYYQRNRDGIVEYYIKVVHNGREWIIKRRYKEFAKLHDHLVKDGYIIDSKFPEKVMWKKNDKKILNKRLEELRVYFRELLTKYSVAESSLLKEFLEVEVIFLQLARKQNVAETIRLDRIPQIFLRSVIPAPLIQRKFSMSQFSSLKKAKSFSFSNKTTPIRKDSMSQYDTPVRDRKFSMDIFNLSATHSSDAATLQATMKKSSFIKATEALWDHYSRDIYEIEQDELDLDINRLSKFMRKFALLQTNRILGNNNNNNNNNNNSNSNNSNMSLSGSNIPLRLNEEIVLNNLSSSSSLSFYSSDKKKINSLAFLNDLNEKYLYSSPSEENSPEERGGREDRSWDPLLLRSLEEDGLVIKEFHQIHSENNNNNNNNQQSQPLSSQSREGTTTSHNHSHNSHNHHLSPTTSGESLSMKIG
jgi:hypothetical protein